MEATVSTAKEQPDLDTKLRIMRGEELGWDYRFQVPPVTTFFWTPHDWITWIGNNWFRIPLPEPVEAYDRFQGC